MRLIFPAIILLSSHFGYIFQLDSRGNQLPREESFSGWRMFKPKKYVIYMEVINIYQLETVHFQFSECIMEASEHLGEITYSKTVKISLHNHLDLPRLLGIKHMKLQCINHFTVFSHGTQTILHSH